MSKITLDSETLAKLNGLTEQTEVYDQDGKLVARLTPVLDEPNLDGYKLPGPDPFSDEDIRELLKTPDPGRPLADILRELRGQ